MFAPRKRREIYQVHFVSTLNRFHEQWKVPVYIVWDHNLFPVPSSCLFMQKGALLHLGTAVLFAMLTLIL